MPELPDITVFIKNLKPIFLNARIKKVKLSAPSTNIIRASHRVNKRLPDDPQPKKTHSPTGFSILQTNNGMMKTFYTEEQTQY